MKLINFLNLNNDEIKLIYLWRNNPATSKNMINQHITFKEHLLFLKNLKLNLDKNYFLIYEKDNPIGVINLHKINKNSCKFGLYKNPNLNKVGQILINEIFKLAIKMNYKEIYSSVKQDNEKAIYLYKKNGFKITKKDENYLYIKKIL